METLDARDRSRTRTRLRTLRLSQLVRVRIFEPSIGICMTLMRRRLEVDIVRMSVDL
jgi:hypothetical protein